MFRKLALSLAVAAGLALPIGDVAEAAIGDGSLAAGAAMTHSAPIVDAQFVWGGASYCWYGGGWHGPGFYLCGYPWRYGYGWGGGWGWHGWRGGGWHGGWRGGGWRGGGWRGGFRHGGGFRGGFRGHGGGFRGHGGGGHRRR